MNKQIFIAMLLLVATIGTTMTTHANAALPKIPQKGKCPDGFRYEPYEGVCEPSPNAEPMANETGTPMANTTSSGAHTENTTSGMESNNTRNARQEMPG
jgi:hypothetical protein